jgi:hypothetical protein
MRNGSEKRLGSAATLYGTVVLSFVIRAKPRDLQIYGPFVEMFFDRSEADWKDLRSELKPSHIGLDYVVTFEADCIFDDSRDRDLVDSRQLKAVVGQAYGMSSIRGIHHAQAISAAWWEGEMIKIRM